MEQQEFVALLELEISFCYSYKQGVFIFLTPYGIVLNLSRLDGVLQNLGREWQEADPVHGGEVSGHLR
jgi:hypothetical protein